MDKNEYIRLIDLVRYNEVETFQTDIDRLEFKELMDLYKFIIDYYKSENFDENYDGLKCRAEISCFLLNKEVTVIDSPIEITSKLHDMSYHNLAKAADKAFDYGYFSDTQKYGDIIVNSSFLSRVDQLSFLSKLAQCANYKNDRKAELSYCEKMILLDKSDTKILTNYSYALMRNGEYNQARDILSQCLFLGGSTFQIYNQLAISEVHGNKDFKKAVDTLYKIDFNGIKNDRRKLTFFFNNQLVFSALSGDTELLNNIYEFKEFFELNMSGEALSHWLDLSDLCISLNQAIYQINNSNFDEAKYILASINNNDNELSLSKVAVFLDSFASVMKESNGLKSIDDIKSMLDYVNTLNAYEVFDDYLNIIKSYFHLVYDFYMLLKSDISPVGLQSKKQVLQNHKSNTLTTSEFINKSLRVIKYIDEYKKEESSAILKANVKTKYLKTLEDLVFSPFEASLESSFLYSFSEKVDVNYQLCGLLAKSIFLLQRNEPGFIRNYKSGKTKQLLESDFRDVIYRTLGMSDEITVSSESLSRVGRTDLQIESKKFGIKTFEFKIWGSNDYKEVVSQIYKYMTDFENEGFIFMVNKNQECILDKYKDNLISDSMGYIQDSLEEINFNGYLCYMSKHKILTKTKSIYHFIYNMY